MAAGEKWQYAVPTWLSGVLGAFLICGGILFMAERDEVNWPVFVALLLALFIVLVPWLGLRALSVARSKIRQRAHSGEVAGV
jgi:hypothetical protein